MKPSAKMTKGDIVDALLSALDRRRGWKRLFRFPSIALLLLMAASCASLPGPSLHERPSPLPESSKRYRPVRIASGVREQPGSFAWSPDGKTLAFIDGTVNLYTVESAGLKKVPIENPHFVSWSGGNQLLVLSQEPEMDALFSVDRENLGLAKRTVGSGAEAIYPTTDAGKILVLSKEVREFTFGTEIILRVSALNINGGTEKVFYTKSRTYPLKQLDLRFLMAWAHAGPNPVDNSLLIIEHAMPPVVTPDSRAFEIDPLTGLETEISDNTRDHVFISAGWSPDGRMAVLTDESGYLIIRTVRGREIAIEPSIRGSYPSWSPEGHRIYAGGYLLDLTGYLSETLLENGFWSIAEWSPNGKTLAVAANGDLWLFNDISPSLVSPRGAPGKALKERMALLQNLFSQGGITAQEYGDRHNRLMLSAEE